MTTTTGRTLAYCRISLDTKASGSIKKQRERLSAFETAKGRDPGSIVWFVDESVSGSKVPMRERDGGGRLWTDVRNGDRVIVTKIDRAARSVQDLLNVVAHVKERGASITFIDSDIDTASSSGKLMLTVLGAIAEFEAALISERRKHSLESFINEGRHAVGKAPFGFRSVPNPNGRGLVIAVHPEEGAQVREAVLRVMAGESQNQVREALGMSKTGFNHLLRNPRLAGMTPNNGGVAMTGGVPVINPDAAIVSLAEWNALQSKVGTGDKSWSKAVGYGKALACGNCGERLYLNKSKNEAHSTYRCRGTHARHQAEGLATVSVMVASADEFVEDDFLRRFGGWQYAERVMVDENAARTEAVSLAMVRITEIQRRMADTSDSDAIMALAADLGEAHKARAVAEGLPTETVARSVPTGETYADVWMRAAQDEREAMVMEFGRFVVQAGRLPFAEKVLWESKSGPVAAPGVGLADLSGMLHAREG